MWNKIRFLHDSGYKDLLSNHLIFRQLIDGFVELPHIRNRILERLSKEDKEFHELWRRYEADIIFKLSSQGCDDYIIIEHQSTVQPYMAIRMGRYVFGLYNYLIENHEDNGGRLPNVFPIVLYNGDQQWNAGQNTCDLIGDRIPDPYIPQLSYHLINIKRYPLEYLKQKKNAIHAIFYFEVFMSSEVLDVENLQDLFETIIDQITDEPINVVRKVIKFVGPVMDRKVDQKTVEDIQSIEQAKEFMYKALKRHDDIIRRKGEQSKQRKFVINLINEGCSDEMICRSAEISQGELNQIKKEAKKG